MWNWVLSHASVHEVIEDDLNHAALFRLPPGVSRVASALASELGTTWRSPECSECTRLYHPARVLPRHRFAGAFFCHPKFSSKPGREQIWPFASFPRCPAGHLHLSSGSQWKATKLGILVTGRRRGQDGKPHHPFCEQAWREESNSLALCCRRTEIETFCGREWGGWVVFLCRRLL